MLGVNTARPANATTLERMSCLIFMKFFLSNKVEGLRRKALWLNEPPQRRDDTLREHDRDASSGLLLFLRSQPGATVRGDIGRIPVPA